MNNKNDVTTGTKKRGVIQVQVLEKKGWYEASETGLFWVFEDSHKDSSGELVYSLVFMPSRVIPVSNTRRVKKVRVVREWGGFLEKEELIVNPEPTAPGCDAPAYVLLDGRHSIPVSHCEVVEMT